MTASVLERDAERLAAATHAREVRVIRNPRSASRATLHVITTDPLAGASRPWPWLTRPTTSLWQPVPVAVDEDGNDVTIKLPGRHVLIGGQTGAGKSVAMSQLVAAVALDPTATLRVLDGKEVDLAAWRPRCSGFAGADVREALTVLRAAREDMDARYRDLRRRGLRKVTPGDPLSVVVCDELAFYLHGTGSDKFAELLRDLVARGRAAGVIVLAATQKPAADTVPTALRDLFSDRWALATSTPQMSDTILGAGWAASGYDATSIATGQQGTGYLLAEEGTPRRCRSFFLTDEQLEALAARAPAPVLTGPPEAQGRGERGAPAETVPEGDTVGAPAAPSDAPAPPPGRSSASREGLKRVSAEAQHRQRQKIDALLLEFPGKSDRAIAREVGCDHKTVGRARRRLALQPPTDTTLT